jgi:hypothetical protein
MEHRLHFAHLIVDRDALAAQVSVNLYARPFDALHHVRHADRVAADPGQLADDEHLEWRPTALEGRARCSLAWPCSRRIRGGG